MKRKTGRIFIAFSAFVVMITAGSVVPLAEEMPEEPAKAPVTLQSTFDEMADSFTVKKSECGMKYAFYSPVKSEEDTTRYPLVVYVHGRFHGWTDNTFKRSGLTYWCAEEMQAMFEAGGAHLLMPRNSFWFGQAEKVYQVIGEYLEQNSNTVDADRVFIMGGSAGGSIAWKTLITHPEQFCAGVMLCSLKAPSEKEMAALTDVPIWEISAVIDPFSFYHLNQKSTWEKITAISHAKSLCRWTVFQKGVTLPDGSRPFLPHFLAKTIGYNLCLLEDGSVLPGCTTVDGDGNTVDIALDNSIIQWMNSLCGESE